MRQLIRLEHSDGHGIFSTYLLDEQGEILEDRWNLAARVICPPVSDRHQDFNLPEEDGITFIEGKHFCAYKSVAQMGQWIEPEELKIFLEAGFKVFFIEVIECLEGEHQICYEKRHIIKKIDITNLFL